MRKTVKDSIVSACLCANLHIFSVFFLILYNFPSFSLFTRLEITSKSDILAILLFLKRKAA